jgi:type IV secretory pathway TraG/TraD family ATPase VirD4
LETVYSGLAWVAAPLISWLAPLWNINTHGEIIFAFIASLQLYAMVARTVWTRTARSFGVEAPEWYAHYLKFIGRQWRRIYLVVAAPLAWWRRQMHKHGNANANWESNAGILARYVFVKGKSIPIGTFVWRAKRFLQPLAIWGERGLNVFGSAGSGKSATFGTILGTLSNSSSALFMDVGAGLTNALGRWLAKNHPLVVLNLTSNEVPHQGSWNLFREFDAVVERTGNRASVAALAKVAGEAMVLQENLNQPTFDNGGRDFWVALLVYVWLTASQENQTLVSARHLLCCGIPTTNPKETPMDRLLFEMTDIVHTDDGAGGLLNQLVARGAATLRGSNNRDGGNPFLSSARRATSFLDLEISQRITATSSFQMADLKQGNTVVSVVGSIQDVRYVYQPFVRLAFEVMSYTFQTMGRCRKGRGLALAIIDEAQNLGPLTLVESGPYMRKNELQVISGWQDLPGLMGVFSKTWQSILANVDANVFLSTTCEQTTQYISRMLGKTTIRRKVDGTPWWMRPFTPKHAHVSPRYVEEVVDLKNPAQVHDLLAPGFGRMIVLNANRPFIAAVNPFWKALPVWRCEPAGYPENWGRTLSRFMVAKLAAVWEWAKPKMLAFAQASEAIYEGRLMDHLKAYWIACIALSIGNMLWDAASSFGLSLWLCARLVAIIAIVIGAAHVIRFFCMPFAAALWKRRDNFPERGHLYQPALFPLAFFTLLLSAVYLVPLGLARFYFPDPAPVLEAIRYNWTVGNYFELVPALLFGAFLGVWGLVAGIAGFIAAWIGMMAEMMLGIAMMYFFWYFVGVPVFLWLLRTALRVLPSPHDGAWLRRAAIRWLGEMAFGASQQPNNGEGQP